MQGRKIMSPQKAVQILMMSPCYFKMDLLARKVLVDEFCARHDDITGFEQYPNRLFPERATARKKITSGKHLAT